MLDCGPVEKYQAQIQKLFFLHCVLTQLVFGKKTLLQRFCFCQVVASCNFEF